MMKVLLEKWDQKPEQVKLQKVTPTVWHVQSGELEYTLKRRTDYTSVWAEYDLMNWLQAQGVPVCAPILSNTNSPWVDYEGSIYVLYCYVTGIAGNQFNHLSDLNPAEIGIHLAKLHQSLASYPQVTEFPVMNLYKEISSWAWPTVKNYVGSASLIRLADIEKSVEKFYNLHEGLSRQLIHRDFHPGNLVFADDKLVGIIDFDRVRTGLRIFDISYFCTAILSDVFDKPSQRAQWELFVQKLIQSYMTVLPLTRSEGVAFIKVAYLIQILFTAYYLDAGDNMQAERNLAMLQWLYEQSNNVESHIEQGIVG